MESSSELNCDAAFGVTIHFDPISDLIFLSSSLPLFLSLSSLLDFLFLIFFASLYLLDLLQLSLVIPRLPRLSTHQDYLRQRRQRDLQILFLQLICPVPCRFSLNYFSELSWSSSSLSNPPSTTPSSPQCSCLACYRVLRRTSCHTCNNGTSRSHLTSC